MTTIGKILVIVNFVFSIVVGYLIINVFAQGTNWEVSYNNLKKYYEVSQANEKTYYVEAQEIKAARDVDNKRNAGLLDRKDEAIKQKDLQLAAALEQNAALKTAANLSAASTQNATQELLRIKDELKLEQTKVADREKKIVELAKLAKDQQDKAVQADIRARSFQERLLTVTSAFETVTRENERLKLGTAGPARGVAERRPPPEDVNGIVKAADNRSGLVTISIGSDAGISKGNSLYVYRLSPKPLYLGEIQILDVNAHEAVGRPSLAQRGSQLQSGDIVASQINSQR